MSALESRIDDLYQQPLGEFTAARNALAKTLTGAEAARVRALAKPTVVAWAVNLLHGQARATFDRLRKSGEQLRSAQIAMLKGKTADVRGASDAHRKAIMDAAAQAGALAARAGASPDADELTRTLEALSVAAAPPEPPGRLTRPLKPAGFEALSGVSPVAAPIKQATHKSTDTETRRKAEAARRLEAELKQAEEAVDRASAAEAKARAAWERARRELAQAEASVARARDRLKD